LKSGGGGLLDVPVGRCSRIWSGGISMETNDDIDFYRIESLLSADEQTTKEQVRRFVDQDCMAIIADHFDKGTFPMHLIPEFAQLGLFGIHIEGYGCRKRNHTVYGLVCREFGRCDSGLRAMFSVQNSLVMFPIFTFGSEAHRRNWLPKMARGEAIGCFGLSEPDFGSNPAGMQTRATKKGASYVLNGKKMWITNGTIAEVAIIWAKLDNEIRGFLVETDTPGFRAAPIQRKFSYRTSPTALIDLKNCEIPQENLLPEAKGLKPVFQCLNLARYGVACGALGASISCFQNARDFAIHREVFDRPIASYQLVQEQLVRMMVEITKAQLVSYHLGRLLDENRAKPSQISLAKLNNVREALKIARMARDILGARGILADHHVIRHLCDLEAVSTLEGTANMHTLILGQDLTGMSAFV
jgi:glutaryl-CoA dehydrogenase